jgi:tetratricopeptide (TPR) repeat protein
LFSSKKYKEALAAYNQAVLLAPFPSDCDEKSKASLAKAFGNRSAALFHLRRFGETVRDVDHAMEFGYPLETSAKLVLRKTQALCGAGRPDLALAAFNGAVDAVPGLASPSCRGYAEKLRTMAEKLTKTELAPGVDEFLSSEKNLRYLDYAGMKKRVGQLVPGHDFSDDDGAHRFASSGMSLSPVKVEGGHPDCYAAVRDIKAGWYWTLYAIEL